MIIRPAARYDQEFLWDALLHAIHVPPNHPPPAPDVVRAPQLARYVEDWSQRTDDFGFIAEDDARPFAAAWLRRFSVREPGYGFVNEETPELSMSVIPTHRGRGIGTLLLQTLLSAAEKRFGAVSLSVSESNRARHLYQREGFVRVGDPAAGSITMLKVFPSSVEETEMR